MGYVREESLKRKTEYAECAYKIGGFVKSLQGNYFDAVVPIEELLGLDIIDWDSTQLFNAFKCLRYLDGQTLYWLHLNLVAYYDLNGINPNPAIQIHDAVLNLSKLGQNPA